MQLSLLPTIATHSGKPIELPLEQRTILTIVPVPSNLATAPNRYYLQAQKAEQHWNLGIQLTAIEVEFLLARLADLDWELDDDGKPIDALLIHQFVEWAIDEKFAEQAIEWMGGLPKC